MKTATLVALLVAVISSAGCRDAAVERVLIPVAPVPKHVATDSYVDYGSTPVDDTAHVQPGHYTIVYYHWAQCPACRSLDRVMPHFLKARPDVVVRRLRLGNNWSRSAALRDFNRDIGATPFILVFDTAGKLVAGDQGMGRQGTELLYQWMNHEADRSWERSNPSLIQRLSKWLFYG